MEISAVFRESALVTDDMFWERLQSLPMNIKIDGHEWDRNFRFVVTESIIDFTDAASEDDWIELDFSNFSVKSEKGMIIVSLFYPEQDLRYKNKRQKTLNIMKYVFGLLSPVIVLQAETINLAIALQNKEMQEFDTSFLVLDQRLLTISEAESLLWNTDLHTVERLSEHTIWINGPLGLGDETFHLTEAQYMPLSESAEFTNIQNARRKHQLALTSVMRAINWRLAF